MHIEAIHDPHVGDHLEQHKSELNLDPNPEPDPESDPKPKGSHDDMHMIHLHGHYA